MSSESRFTTHKFCDLWPTQPHSFSFFKFLCIYLFISWRLITLQYCSGFCHTLTWISHGYTCVPHPNPPSLSTQSLWVFPVHQPWALVSCIQPGLVICFTLDNIHVSMLFSGNIPPSPSPTESKSLFYTSGHTVFLPVILERSNIHRVGVRMKWINIKSA